MEEIQGAAACSFIIPSLLQDSRSCVQLMVPECNASCKSETWPLTRPDLQRLRRNNRTIIRQICIVKPEDVATVRSNKLLAQLEIDYLDIILREKALLVWTR